jgi:sugar phosphate isomerase/epimerase
MRLGIFAKTFSRPTLAAALEAVVEHGLRCVQFNMACAGLPSMPDRITAELSDAIRREAAARQIEIAAVSGTFNMAHPDPSVRTKGLDRLRVLAEAAPAMGTRVITLCTGSRDGADMWRHHQDNDAPEAWRDMVATIREAVAIARGTGVTLAFEPEINNVVNSAAQSRRLLDEIASLELKVVIDGANLFEPGDLSRMREVLEESISLLGSDIVLAHAKEIAPAGHTSVAAGAGALDFEFYLRRLSAAHFNGPLILHGLEENQVNESAKVLRRHIDELKAWS